MTRKEREELIAIQTRRAARILRTMADRGVNVPRYNVEIRPHNGVVFIRFDEIEKLLGIESEVSE